MSKNSIFTAINEGASMIQDTSPCVSLMKRTKILSCQESFVGTKCFLMRCRRSEGIRQLANQLVSKLTIYTTIARPKNPDLNPDLNRFQTRKPAMSCWQTHKDGHSSSFDAMTVGSRMRESRLMVSRAKCAMNLSRFHNKILLLYGLIQ